MRAPPVQPHSYLSIINRWRCTNTFKRTLKIINRNFQM